jgi:hypothetical protein
VACIKGETYLPLFAHNNVRVITFKPENFDRRLTQKVAGWNFSLTILLDALWPLWLTQLLTEMITKIISWWVKAAGA